MDIHKPKSWHGFREFLKEYLIIVVGVLTALGAEQAVETLHWQHKVAQAEEAMKAELATNLSYAAEQRAMNACANRYIDRLQQSVADNRPDIIRALFKMGAPIDAHPWRLDTWTAALNAQVPDHLTAERVGDYSLVFRFVAAERDQQWEMIDLYSEAMAGRFGRLGDEGVANDQLKAGDRLRANEARREDITGALLTASRRLGVSPSPERAEEFRAKVRVCEAGLAAIGAP